jgi:sugar lactone lactonase YvrE
VEGLGIANGLCFSPDSRFCYLADSARKQIYRYVFDADSGALRDRSLLAESLTGGSPDGAAVDVDGCIWSAQWGTGEVIRYTPEGKLDLRLQVPTRQPSCVAFGGRARDLLFVTSARAGLTATDLAQESSAGHVFVFRTGHTGLVESRYRET